jgi:thymidylate synthase (FAD)
MANAADDMQSEQSKSRRINPKMGSEHSSRIKVPALDEILGVPFRVLDEGFIRLIDYMGNDSAVVQAARISYGDGTKKLQEDRALIRFLMRHSHTTPFEMCEIKLHIRAPMDVWRQWIRHRTANVNEYSTRYSVAIDVAQRTSSDMWRFQSNANKQGSSGGFLSIQEGERLSAEEAQMQNNCRDVYNRRLAAGVAREQARKDLPLCTYTEAYWKIDLHNLLHFLHLRMDPHAQQEIRSYANVIAYEFVARWVPIVWEAFTDYRRSAMQLSRIEFEVISAIIGGHEDRARVVAAENGLLQSGGKSVVRRNRELNELEQKLKRLGLRIPWG